MGEGEVGRGRGCNGFVYEYMVAKSPVVGTTRERRLVSTVSKVSAAGGCSGANFMFEG